MGERGYRCGRERDWSERKEERQGWERERKDKKRFRVGEIGDFDQFMNKYNTCARTRPYGDKFLASKFYMNEHTKPLFNANKIWF